MLEGIAAVVLLLLLLLLLVVVVVLEGSKRWVNEATVEGVLPTDVFVVAAVVVAVAGAIGALVGFF